MERYLIGTEVEQKVEYAKGYILSLIEFLMETILICLVIR